MREAARLADIYGNGEIRITTSQNVIIPNVPEDDLSRLLAEPLLLELSADPPEVIRGLVACTGKDYCHFSLIETKELAVKTARSLASTVGRTGPLSMRWSGWPNGCGNHLQRTAPGPRRNHQERSGSGYPCVTPATTDAPR